MQGQTWTVSTKAVKPAADAPATQWLIENIIVRYNGTSMLQTFRSNTSVVWQSWSHDDGRTWTDAAPGPVTAPNTKVRRHTTPCRQPPHGCTFTHVIAMQALQSTTS